MKPIYKNLDRPAIKYNDLAEIIRKICAKEEPGTVLCFLPRIIDISTMKSILEEETDDNKTLEINVCHSKVPYQVQHRVFVPAPAGIRKVVLCTNICEVGITVPDVTVVIDTGVENILTLVVYFHFLVGITILLSSFLFNISCLIRLPRSLLRIGNNGRILFRNFSRSSVPSLNIILILRVVIF